MMRVTFMSARGAWNASAFDSIVLDHRQRAERDVPMTGVRGTQFEIALPASVTLRGGDALVLDDGRLIEIVAAPEELSEARHADPRIFARLAYHIGKAGLAAEIQDKRIRYSRNSATDDALRTLGARVLHIEAPLEPDTGAFEAPHTAPAPAAHSHDHGHDHKHGHEHDHDHKHDHGRTHEKALGHGHKHEHVQHSDHEHADKHKHQHAHDHDDKHDHGHKH